MSEAEFSQQLDLMQSIFRQIERYQKTWNKIEKTRHQKPSGKVSYHDNLDVVQAQAWKHAKGLRTIVKPKVNKEQREKLQQFDSAEQAEELFDLCFKMLSDHNVVWENNSDFVVEDRSDSKLEPEDSNVSEEVV